jgi:cytochrome P450
MSSAGEAQPFTFEDLPVRDDRDAAWRLIRARGPIVQLEPDVALTDHALVEAAFRNPAVFSSKKAFDSLGSPLPLVPIAFDPPEHARYRHILQPFFSPRSIRPLEPELRRQLAELIAPLPARGECDFVADVASVFPVQAFLTFFGLPMEMRDQFVAWKDAILGLSDPSGAISSNEDDLRHAGELFTYLSELVATRRGVPGPDVLSELLCLEGDDALTDAEVIGLCFLFVLAGLDTVTDALGFGMERLARNPDRRQELVDDPTLVPAAVEELLRLDPPAPFVPRITTAPTDLGGRTLPAGTRVTAYIAACNRDEARYPDPYGIDFHRGDNPHASFGVGVHRCLGSHLARLEMRLVYEEWHRLIPHYDLAPGFAPTVKFPRGTVGLEALALVFTPGAAR